MKKLTLFLYFFLWIINCGNAQLQPLKVSSNQRYLQTADGKPFFWLGDTGWLLFSKLNREEAEKYLEDRRQKGFNVIQVMVQHEMPEINCYGDTACRNNDVLQPIETKGNNYSSPSEYDYWDHVDYMVKLAEQKGIYMALVPAWGSFVKDKRINATNAAQYADWLSKRYHSNNIIWLIGGDVRGDVSPEVWDLMGNTIRKNNPNQLITFHPFGRTSSSYWFHNKEWLDFNMFQSGHTDYEQYHGRKDSATWKGQDNWRYVVADYLMMPPKPTIDGEPSYEGIPHGLHDFTQPFWTANDTRRYAWWSIISGSFGHTFGNSAIMQFHRPQDGEGAYGVKKYWQEALNDSGASQLIHLKNLLLSYPFYERTPDFTLVASPQKEKYGFLPACRGQRYAMIYSYRGESFDVNMGKIDGVKVKCFWYNPRSGEKSLFGVEPNVGVKTFIPPGKPADGNDWLLILEGIE